ncbi:helicase [Pseudoclavibacter sp. AY1H1]|uniref:helicase n=1 Tax=Pseudoclavibacter sp. AY1H1 TaxID=2080584 RepID=UPI0015E2957B|nr:helicase [Pseudoclavibacter sp. AY1H1]
MFNPVDQVWANEYAELRELLDDDAWTQARRTVLNAHYTSPEFTTAMWDGLRELGFDGGRVLEPGSGLGTFIGTAPDGARMTGVELDATTALISRLLQPQAEIRTGSFTDVRFPDGYFDATIGNVPFGQVKLRDALHNPGRALSLHNHFLAKSLHLTRPGGMVVALTSRHTLDAADDSARRRLYELGDLVGAVRLPERAHKELAGTDVITDVLVFRRREEGAERGDARWLTVADVDSDQPVAMNGYFHAHPEHVLGHVSADTGRFGPELRVVAENASDAAPLREALTGIARSAVMAGHGMTARTRDADMSADTAMTDDLTAAPEGTWEGTLVEQDGGLFEVTGGHLAPVKVAKTALTEVRSLVAMRDLSRDLVTLEAETLEDTAELAELRTELRTTYETHLAAYGPVNRIKLIELKSVDPDTGEPRVQRRTPPATRAFRQDPGAALVFALENYDEQEQRATPAGLLLGRVRAPRPVVTSVDTPADAVAVSLDRHGRIDVETIAGLLGVEKESARSQLDGLAFEDPADNVLQPRAEYLSGNVRIKLREARAAALEDPRFHANVAALENAQPAPLGVEDVYPQVGASWIDSETFQVFLQAMSGDRNARVKRLGASDWLVTGGRSGVASTDEYGTVRRPFGMLYASLLNMTEIKVTDRDPDGREIPNPEETAAALEKAEEIREKFQDWVFNDPARASRLLAIYNERFNAIALRDYSTEGQALQLPGLAETFTPHPHQRAAVARMIAEPTVGLFHEVGAGKTAEMVIGTMELRRLGFVTKPVVVVPNHMLEQFSREWLQLYPSARVLAADSGDVTKEHRRKFVARAVTNPWDAIIMTRTAFKGIPVSPEWEDTYSRRELAVQSSYLDRAVESGAMTIKEAEDARSKLEQTIANQNPLVRDLGVATFEQMGIDYLVVDEMHDFKGLAIGSKLKGANIPTVSGRATDLHMKMELLRATSETGRIATVATATPLSNSLVEAYTMQRYLRPDLLEEAGVHDFEAWAATFGELHTEMEVDVAGGMKTQTRLSRFKNLPEMLRLWRVAGDVKTAADLDLPTPELALNSKGQARPEMVIVPASPAVREYIGELRGRIDKLTRADKSDNMLRISSDGRKAALDAELVGLSDGGVETKIGRAVENIARIYRENAANSYVDPDTGNEAAHQGALQIVFLDLGTPNKDRGWSVYEKMRDRLAAAGVPRSEIAFVQDAKGSAKKAALFKAARDGQVSVLFGSTETMGVGTNVQRRAIALHDIDCPWRPSDLQQRAGRIMRQGNQNDVVQHYRYATSHSFDAFMWQKQEQKGRFIAQAMRGDARVRDLEDIGTAELEAGEAKALATGNPKLVQHAQLRTDVTKLRRLERAHAQSQATLRMTVDNARARVSRLEREIEQLEAALPHVRELDGDRFSMTVGRGTFAKRTEAGQQLVRLFHRGGIPQGRGGYTTSSARAAVGELSGMTVLASRGREFGKQLLYLELQDVPGSEITADAERFLQSPEGAVTRLANRIAAIPAGIAERRLDRDEKHRVATEAEERIGLPFRRADELRDKWAEFQALNKELAREAARPRTPEERPARPVDVHADHTHTRPVSGSGPAGVSI